jgi:hypothetical protein
MAETCTEPTFWKIIRKTSTTNMVLGTPDSELIYFISEIFVVKLYFEKTQFKNDTEICGWPIVVRLYCCERSRAADMYCLALSVSCCYKRILSLASRQVLPQGGLAYKVRFTIINDYSTTRTPHNS